MGFDLTVQDQLELLTKDCGKFLLKDPIPVLETSRRRDRFHLRHTGSWLLRNAAKGDTIFVTELQRLGATIKDYTATLRHFLKSGCRVIINRFHSNEPIVLEGHIFQFFVQLLEGVDESYRNVRQYNYNENLAKRQRDGSLGKSLYQWGCRSVVVDDPRASRGKRKGKLVWDNTQLKYLADISRRWLVNDEPLKKIVKQYHRLGIRDHTGCLFGTRGKWKATDHNFAVWKVFREAAAFFMRMGLEEKLPPEWNDVCHQIDLKRIENGIPLPDLHNREMAAKHQTP